MKNNKVENDSDRLKKGLDDLHRLIDIQCSDGNWNYDSYMHGLANGMLVALSLFDGKDPKFLEPPEKWLIDTIDKSKLLSSIDVAVKS